MGWPLYEVGIRVGTPLLQSSPTQNLGMPSWSRDHDTHALNPMTPCSFVCGPQNGNHGNWLYYKIFSNLCARHQHHSENDITFLSILVYLPVFVFSFINHSVFECRSREVFLKFTGQTNIGFTGSSVHNHICVITFFNRKLQSCY